MMDPTKTAGGARRRLAVVLVFAMAAATIAVVSGGGAAGATDDGSSAGAVSFDKPSAVEVTATLVQTLDTSTIVPGSPDPAGISYLPGVGNLVFTDSEINEYTYYEPARVNTWHLTTTSPPLVAATGSTLVISHGLGEDPPTKWSREPTGIAVDPGAVPAGFAGPRIWTTDDVRQDLFEVDTGADGLVGTADDVRKKIIATDLFGSLDPEGVTYNATEGWLHIIDGASETVYTIDPGPNAKFEGAGSDDVITSFGCFDHGCRNPEGIAWNSATGRLAIISKTGKQVVTEFSTNGYHLRDIDIASVTSTLDKPAGATWAPGSGGGTSLWVTDRGVDDPDGFFDHDGNPATPEIPLIDGNVFEYTVPDVAAVPVLMNMPTDTLDFGDVGVGVPKMLPVTILNSGGAAMTGTVAVTDGTKGFTVPSGGAFALDPGEFVDIDIKFDPPMGSTPAIAFADTLSIVSTGGADSVALTGGGVAPIPDISVAPTSAAFGSVETGTQKNIPVKVTNVGSSPLSVASTTVTGGPGFSIDSGGGTFVLAPGASQDVVVKFIPAALGSVTGKLAIASDDPDTPTVDVPLSGTGAAGLIDISVPSSTDLGSVALGTRGEKTVRVTNSGTSPLTVTGLDVTGDSEFSLLLVGLPFTLTAGEFKDITVRFDPFTLGLYTGNLAVTSNDPDEGTVNVALKGTGAAPITCPTASTPFTDVSASSFAATDIKCIYGLKVTTGTTATTYSPGNLVTREQMASFMARVYAVLAGTACPTPPVPFTDVSGSFHLNDIKCIFGLGVTTGTSATTYSPGDFVSREQMGSFLARLYKALVGSDFATTTHPFVDVSASSVHNLDIGRIFNLGITTGTSATTYSPFNFVTREQMASFLARLIRLLSL